VRRRRPERECEFCGYWYPRKHMTADGICRPCLRTRPLEVHAFRTRRERELEERLHRRYWHRMGAYRRRAEIQPR
jgi:hypothetical protein